MTRAQLAEQVGLSASAISNYTLGRDKPDPVTVFAIEQAVDVTPGTLSELLGFAPLDGHHMPGVVDALMLDPKLRPEHRDALLVLYRSLIEST